jgi:hypothetical protein
MSPKRKKRVIRYTLELLVVFIGVTAGFLLNSWREDRQEKNLEQRYLKSFLADLKNDRNELDSLLLRTEGKVAALSDILLKTEVAGQPLTENLAQEVVKEILYIEWFPPTDDTFDDMINSGNLNIVSDFDLRESISAYYAYLKETATVEGYYTSHMNEQVLPYLYKHFRMYQMTFLEPSGYLDPEFSNLYIGTIAFLQQNANMYQDALERNRVLSALLGDAISE